MLVTPHNPAAPQTIDITGGGNHGPKNPAPSKAPPPASEVPREAQSPSAEALRLNQLARAERASRDQQRRFESEKAQLATQLEAQKTEIEQFKAWKQKWSQDPVSVLTQEGISGDVITHGLLNQPTAEEMRARKLEQEIQAVREAQEKTLEQINAQKTEAYEQTRQQIRHEATNLVNSSGAFKATKALGATDAIAELIEQTFFGDEELGIPGGYLMSVEEAAKAVEAHLRSDFKKTFEDLRDIYSTQAPKQEAFSQAKKQQHQQPRNPITTLSNRQIPAPSSKPYRTERERKERAIMRAQGVDPDTGNPLARKF